MAFNHAYKARVNLGVIAGVLTSSVVFTTINFWIFYRESISFITFTGMTLILIGVICVGWRPPSL